MSRPPCSVPGSRPWLLTSTPRAQRCWALARLRPGSVFPGWPCSFRIDAGVRSLLRFRWRGGARAESVQQGLRTGQPGGQVTLRESVLSSYS